MDPRFVQWKVIFWSLDIANIISPFSRTILQKLLPVYRDAENLITDSLVLECLQLCPSPGVGIVPIFPLPWCIDITMFVTILLWHGMCPFLSFHCLDYLQIFPMNPSHFIWLMVWFMMLSARTVVKKFFWNFIDISAEVFYEIILLFPNYMHVHLSLRIW